MKELESLRDIFSNRLFKIPDYQRGYAWTTKQLKDFWEDTINLPSDRRHYTGVLSLKIVGKTVWKNWNDDLWLLEDQAYGAYHIVDGQQRLTTFVIFIQAIVELVKNIPGNDERNDENIYLGSLSLKQIKEYYLVIQRPPNFLINTYKFSYEVDNPSFKFLKYRIFKEEGGGAIQETFYTLNLENAILFFKENLFNFYKEYGIGAIESLYKKVTQNLMFNVYEISDDFDVFVAFETMNNRGKKLSNLELLKNRLIYLTTLYSDKELKSDERVSLREKINDSWKEIYFQLGRNKLNPLNDDDFLGAHWIMYFKYSREKGDDYIKFLLEEKFTPRNIYSIGEPKLDSIQEYNEISETISDENEDFFEDEIDSLHSKLLPGEIGNYVSSLKSAASHWYNTYNPTNNNDLIKDEALWIDRLNRMGIMYFRPLVTASFLSIEIDSAKRVELFKSIERFIFITFRLCRTTSNYRNSEYYRAARELRSNELKVEDIIESLDNNMGYYFYKVEEESIEESLTDPEYFFDYTYFQKFLDKKFKSGIGFYSWNGLRYFLYEYEMEKVRQRGSQKIDWKLFTKSENDKVSIEHIYPQTVTNECWIESFREIKASNLVYLNGTLGNLLPLSQSINSSLQNDCFVNKKSPKYNDKNEKTRQGYSDGSHSEIEVSNYNEWTPETILGRGKLMLDFMERRWDLKFESDKEKIELLFLSFLMPIDVGVKSSEL